MTGLSVLYAKEATEEREWSVIPDRDRPSRLREVYWVRRAESKFGLKRFLSAKLSWRPDRTDLGRDRNDPGDGFFYWVDMAPRLEQQFEWLEVDRGVHDRGGVADRRPRCGRGTGFPTIIPWDLTNF